MTALYKQSLTLAEAQRRRVLIADACVYNAQNKLVRIEGRGFTNDFVYDSQNRRIGVKLGAAWRYDMHDGNLCIASVVNGLVDRFFVRGAGIAEGTGDVIAEIPDPRNTSQHPYYYISNHRGDTLAVLDYNYNIAARYEYNAYGNVIEHTGYTPRYTFSTKEYLPAAKLYLYQYRVYDPIAGRWTQRDPIDYQDSLNLYQFCGNNPVNLWDADGCVIWNQFFKGVGAMATGVGMMVTGGGILVGTSPTGVGIAAGSALVVAGHYPLAMGLSKVIAALNDQPVDLPATPGEFVGPAAGALATAVGANETTAKAVEVGAGAVVDNLVSGGLKAPTHVAGVNV